MKQYRNMKDALGQIEFCGFVDPIGHPVERNAGYESLVVMADDMETLRELVWGMDIPHPTTPEYTELHEKMQRILQFIDKHFRAVDET